ncbi:pyridoxal-dependent decarboxylase [Umezawaea beigongshangensis]|uniref:pyridoxal-dependent decarboxylase n=1 Tax=Umezawaea beigongshangensis TaxID=2780383 RepID=UPI001E390262|nr:pyridoxal-dependent decarboxylase [Umezawaea beigongshangensis]
MTIADKSLGDALVTADQPTDEDFTLPSGGLDDASRKEVLAKLEAYYADVQPRFLGYQTNQELDLRQDMASFLNYNINNVGDPFRPSHYTLDSRAAERSVLAYYARLWHAKPREHDEHGGLTDPEAYWGYVLTMGSSEGNNYALWNARDYLSGKTLMVEPDENGTGTLMWVQDTAPVDNQNAYSPVAFYSQDTHYSVSKALRVLNIPTFYEVGTKMYPHANPLNPGQPWDMEVPSQDGADGPGSVDVDKLITLVDFFAKMGHPVVLNLNYGSTFKGAYDDVATICSRLTAEVFTKYGLDKRKVRYGRDPETGAELVDERTGYWIHVDGALGATYAPFLERAIEQGLVDEPGATLPAFDFRVPEVSSIVTSGHKYPGAPWPCGIFMTKSNLQMQPPTQPAVIGSPDTTFGGSRNAFSPLIMWNFLARHSEQAQLDMVVRAQRVADYAARTLAVVPGDWQVARTPYSLSVRFRQPSDEIVHKYSLATVPLRDADGGHTDYAHLYVMPHVTEELIDELAADLALVEVPAPRDENQSITAITSYIDGTADTPDIARLALVRTWNQAF